MITVRVAEPANLGVPRSVAVTTSLEPKSELLTFSELHNSQSFLSALFNQRAQIQLKVIFFILEILTDGYPKKMPVREVKR